MISFLKVGNKTRLRYLGLKKKVSIYLVAPINVLFA